MSWSHVEPSICFLTNQQRSDIYDFDNMVTVLVGKEEKRFTLHQDAVCAKSKFFKAACSKEWLEGQERVVRLPETQVTTFQEYCSWIYSSKIAVGTCTQASALAEKGNELQRLMYLHILGDELDDIQLRNKANVELFKAMQKSNAIPDAQLNKMVWESTMPGSLLRKLLVDAIVARFTRHEFAAAVSQYPAECVQEIAVAALQAAPVSSWEHMAQRLSPYKEAEGTS